MATERELLDNPPYMAHTPKPAGLAARRLAEIAGGDTGAGTRFVRDKDPSSPARTITAGPGESSRPVPVPKHPAREGLPRPRTSAAGVTRPVLDRGRWSRPVAQAELAQDVA